MAGDCADAKERVGSVIRGAGFTPVDLGALTAAATIEDIPVSLFSSWRKPFIVHIILFVFLYLLSFAKFQVPPALLLHGKIFTNYLQGRASLHFD